MAKATISTIHVAPGPMSLLISSTGCAPLADQPRDKATRSPSNDSPQQNMHAAEKVVHACKYMYLCKSGTIGSKYTTGYRDPVRHFPCPTPLYHPHSGHPQATSHRTRQPGNHKPQETRRFDARLGSVQQGRWYPRVRRERGVEGDESPRKSRTRNPAPAVARTPCRAWQPCRQRPAWSE